MRYLMTNSNESWHTSAVTWPNKSLHENENKIDDRLFNHFMTPSYERRMNLHILHLPQFIFQ